MPHTTLSKLATEYRRVPVATRADDGLLESPVTTVVSLAFMTEGDEPEDADWVDAEWETSESVFVDERGWPQPTATPYKVRLLIGPEGDVELDIGTWNIWVKIVDNPETIVRRVGAITIFGEEETT